MSRVTCRIGRRIILKKVERIMRRVTRTKMWRKWRKKASQRN